MFSTNSLGLSFLFTTIENVFGSREKAKNNFPLLAGSFFFILFANLLGMIPGFLAPTGNLNTNGRVFASHIRRVQLLRNKGARVRLPEAFSGPCNFPSAALVIIGW